MAFLLYNTPTVFQTCQGQGDVIGTRYEFREHKNYYIVPRLRIFFLGMVQFSKGSKSQRTPFSKFRFG